MAVSCQADQLMPVGQVAYLSINSRYTIGCGIKQLSTCRNSTGKSLCTYMYHGQEKQTGASVFLGNQGFWDIPGLWNWNVWSSVPYLPYPNLILRMNDHVRHVGYWSKRQFWITSRFRSFEKIKINFGKTIFFPKSFFGGGAVWTSIKLQESG